MRELSRTSAARPRARALPPGPGDSFADFGARLALNEWLRGGVTHQQVVEGLWPLLGLPVEVVCPAHGAPTDRAPLERALSL